MKQITEAYHPETKELYTVGDKVVIYQGRFGHDNIIEIKSMWQNENDPTDHICVSSELTLPGTFLSAVKRKITDKEIKKIRNLQYKCEEALKYNINL